MTTFKEGYKGDWDGAVQSNVQGGEMFRHDRSFDMKSLEALMSSRYETGRCTWA